MAQVAPLADALRPRTLDEVVGQDHLVGPGAPLRTLAESGELSSLILWGPAGTGKTSLARILASSAKMRFVTVSAVSSGVKDLREVIAEAREKLSLYGERTILFIDEVHRFNKAQQDLLLPVTESGEIVLIGATTENPYFEVNAALMSRTTLWRLNPHDAQSIGALVDRGAQLRGVTLDDDARDALVAVADGDGRASLTTLDVAIVLAGAAKVVTREHVAAARDGRVMHQSADSHYDQVSAMIKSIRGSDPDAALWWMLALLDSGESPRFIARRLVVLASEDIGLAHPYALLLAEATHRAVEFVGLPEARFNLAHCVIELALMPKSNSVTVALERASAALANGGSVEVPAHLRDAHYSSAGRLGHGVGYVYPHSDPRSWVEQQYLPDSVAGGFYEARNNGAEALTYERWLRTRNEGSAPLE